MFRAFFLFCLFLSVSESAFANARMHSIMVDGVQRYFRAGEVPVQNVTVTNHSDKALSLKTSIVRYTKPGRTAANEVSEMVPADEDFIFAPKLFRLKAGESRQVRMVLAKPLSDKERIYAISFDPFDFDYDDVEDYEGGIDLGLGFIKTSAVVVVVSPKKPDPVVEWERDETGVTFYNKGNVSIDLTMRRNVCVGEFKDDCLNFPGYRIYPGLSYRMDLDQSYEVERPYKVYDKPGGVLELKRSY